MNLKSFKNCLVFLCSKRLSVSLKQTGLYNPSRDIISKSGFRVQTTTFTFSIHKKDNHRLRGCGARQLSSGRECFKPRSIRTLPSINRLPDFEKFNTKFNTQRKVCAVPSNVSWSTRTLMQNHTRFYYNSKCELLYSPAMIEHLYKINRLTL